MSFLFGSGGLRDSTFLSALFNVTAIVVVVMVISTVISIWVGKLITAGSALRVLAQREPPRSFDGSLSEDMAADVSIS